MSKFLHEPIFARWVFVAAAFLAATPSLRAGKIDFTPHLEERQEDGFTVHETYLAVGSKMRYYFKPPVGWIVRGSLDALDILPPDKPLTTCRISASPFAAPRPPFTGDALEEYRRKARAAVPPDAENVSIISETPDFFTLFGWTDYEITVSYFLHGRELYQSAMFININPDEQMHIIVAAERAEYPALRATLLRVLTSWRRYLLPQ